MKRSTFLSLVSGFLLTIAAAPNEVFARMMGRGRMGGGRMGGGCMMGGMFIPEQLPKPSNAQWISRLQHALDLEVYSKIQYEADVEKFRIHMPYMMVLHQEENHIDLIEKLFAAYGLPANTKKPEVKASESLDAAFDTAIKLEAALFEPYEYLIQNAEDNTSPEVLNMILMQSRMHYRMFSHHKGRGGMMRHRMG